MIQRAGAAYFCTVAVKKGHRSSATVCQGPGAVCNRWRYTTVERTLNRRPTLPQTRHMTSIRLSSRSFAGIRMRIRSPMKQTVGVGLLLLSGCDAARSARNDLTRLMSPQPAASQARKSPASQNTARAQTAKTAPSPSPETSSLPAPSAENATVAAERRQAASPVVVLTGYGEAELKALLGAPISEESHPPGKQWRFRDGPCTLDVQLYPDVETKTFRTLAYKVRRDDNSDEGKRLCLAQLQSRIQSRRQ